MQSNLSIRITGDSASAEAAIERTRTSVTSLAASLAGGIAGGGLAAMIQQAASATIGLVTSSIQATGRLADLSVQTGISVEGLASLSKVARYSDTSIQSITEASGRLSKALFTQNEDSAGAASAIKTLGLELAAFKQLDADQRLLAIANAMEKFRDGTGKSAVAMQLLGREGQQLLPFMKELAERGLMVSTQTTAAALAAKQYADNLVTLTGAGEGLAHQFANELLPSLLNITRQLLAGREAYGSWWRALKDVGLNVDPFKTLNENISATVGEFRKLEAEAEKIKGRQAGGGFWANTFAKADASDLADIREPQKVLDARLAYLRKLQTEAGGRGFWDGASRLAVDAKPDLLPPPLAGPRPKARKTALDHDYLGDAERRIEELYERWWRKNEEALDRIEADEKEAEQARLERARELNDSIVELNIKGAEEILARNKAAAEQASVALSDSIAEGIMHGFRDGQSLAEVFLRELKAQFAKTVLSPIIRPTVEAGNQAIGDLMQLILQGIRGGGPTGTTGGWSFGGTTYNNPSAYVGGLASGGPAFAGQTYLVGEQGPELLRMGAMSGHVTPNRAIGGIGKVEIHNHSGGEVRQERARGAGGEDVLRVFVAAAADEVDRRIASGGSTGRLIGRHFGASRTSGAPRRG